MAAEDRLLYFELRGKAEPTRMLYSLAGVPLEDERISSEWPARKAETPLGQLPVLYTPEGEVNQSNSIARYAAKKLGLFGKGVWEEALHDMIMENVNEAVMAVIDKIYSWRFLNTAPEPEDPAKVAQEVKDKWITILSCIEKVAEKRGAKFIVSDEIGAAEVWLYTSLEVSKEGVPEAMSLTDWTKKFVEKFEADEKVKAHIAARPALPPGGPQM